MSLLLSLIAAGCLFGGSRSAAQEIRLCALTQQTPDVLVIEEGAGTAIFIGSICLGVGAISVIIGWTNEKWLFVIVGTVFALFGLKISCSVGRETHRFERWRGMLAIDSTGLLRSDRLELPLADGNARQPS